MTRVRARARSGGADRYAMLERAAIRAANRNGASLWYVGRDAANVRQLVRGNEPGALGQSVGWLLDHAFDLEGLGPELVIGGRFDSAAGWTFSAGMSVSGGRLIAASSGLHAVTGRPAATFAGRSYLVEFDVLSISQGAVRAILYGIAQQSLTNVTGAGRFSAVVTAAGNNTSVALQSASSTPLSAEIENFSVRELIGGGGLGQERVSDPDIQATGAWSSFTSGASTTQIAIGQIGVNAPAGDFAGVDNSAGQLSETGKTYALTYTVSAATGGGIRIDYGGVSGPPVTAPGVYTHYVTATSATRPTLARAVAAPSSGAISRFSVREVYGVPAVQASTGNRPVLSQMGRYMGLQFDGADDFLATSAAPGDHGTLICAARQRNIVTSGRLHIGAAGTGGGFMGIGHSATPRRAVSAKGFSTSSTETALVPVTEFAVDSVRYDGTTLASWCNGQPVFSANPGGSAGAPVDVGIYLGARNNLGTAQLHSACDILLAAACPAPIPDADRIAIERFAALLCGATYAA